MKKTVLTALIAIMIFSFPLSAGGWHFKGSGLDQHTEILAGFLPTYLQGGFYYDGMPLMDDNTTTYEILLGGGYLQRRVWQNPENGENLRKNPYTGSDGFYYDTIVYDVGVVDWTFRFAQGFFDNPMKTDKDLLVLSVAYEGRFEDAIDSMVKGKTRTNLMSQTIHSLDEYLTFNDPAAGYYGSIYPDLTGNHVYIGTNLNFEVKVDMMNDTVVTMDGFSADFNIDWGPWWLNGACGKYVDYYSFSLDLVGAKTLFQIKGEKISWFSIQVVDRLNFNWTSGDSVPVFMQKHGSLGRKMRGYNSYSYNTEFTTVNNFEFRFTSPPLGTSLLYIRAAAYLDIGYGDGRLYNTEIRQSSFLASTGFEATFCVGDFIDLGITYSYLIEGETYNKPYGTHNWTFQFVFFYDY